MHWHGPLLIVCIRTTVAMSLSLNCLIHGEVQEKMFTVKISTTENVSILKDLLRMRQGTGKWPHMGTFLVIFQIYDKFL